MTVSINGTSGVTFSDASVQNTAATGFGFKNRIINGAMMIDQRNAGASVTPTGGTYTLDRWALAITQASKLSVQQTTTVPAGFKNSLSMTVASAVASPSATDQFLIRQLIEGFNVSDFNWGSANAQSVTLSFWVRSSLTGTFPVAFLNAGFTRSYVSTYTINSANAWEYKTVTISGDTTGTWATDNTAGVNVSFAVGTGSNRTTATANTWQGAEYISTSTSTNLMATSGATFYITGVQLEKSPTATSFDYRPYGTELALCQRYYQTDVTTVAAIPSSSTNMIFSGLRFSVVMRATPTFAISGVSYSGYTTFDTGITYASASTIGPTSYSFNTTNPNSRSTAGSGAFTFTASSEL